MIKAKKKSYPAYDPLKAKGFADRVKALFVERGTINEDISQVCDEAKEEGCEPSMIRYATRELMIDDTVRKERDEKRARYLHAVGLAVEAVKSGEMSARQAAKIYSIGKSSVYKELAVHGVSAPVEMTADDLGDYELIKPKPRVERAPREQVSDDFAAKVRAMIAAAGLKIPERSEIHVIDENEPLIIPAALIRTKASA